MGKTCLDRFNKILDITGKMAAICGANILDPEWKLSFQTWFVMFAIHAFFACTFYTIYIGFVVYDDWKIMLQSLCLAGSAFQGYVKLLGVIFKRPYLRALKLKLESIYAEYQQDEDFLPVLKYRTDLTAKILKIVMGIYISAGSVVIIYPPIYGMIFQEKTLIMQFYLPGIDPKSDSGNLIHNAVHATLMFLGAFGNFAGDMFIFIFITHMPLLKDLLKIKCKKLNVIIEKTKDAKKTMPLIKDIAEWHQYYNDYAEKIGNSYYMVIFFQVSTSVVSISSTLFCMVIGSWPVAFAYLIYSFSMLYAYCGLGHLIELSNDEVIDLFYGDILWYELSVPEQKFVLLMLRKAQTPITLTVGQIMPLSMSTALQLTKAIYSYMMMLINFLNTEDM